ncbi:hypothetical protein P5668_00110 (plasmid) [Bacillus subtilis]|nr:hypothetical protein P5652_22640 [Bacillus subtilis]WGD72677.1 hypothetical protein P5668_00110 [Bacillus subtilis]
MANINQYSLKDNDEFKPPFSAEEASIIIQGQGSQETLDFALALLPILKKINRITHFRNGDKVIFDTYVEAGHYNLIIKGGLSSNYGGEGPNAFKKYLMAAGLNEEDISFLTRYNGEEIAVIEIVL